MNLKDIINKICLYLEEAIVNCFLRVLDLSSKHLRSEDIFLAGGGEHPPPMGGEGEDVDDEDEVEVEDLGFFLGLYL